MLLQIISDLHLETYPQYGAYKHQLTDASYLALLGDIGHLVNPEFEKLMRLFLDHYSVVFYLLGNHDTKDLSMNEAKQRVRSFEAKLTRLTQQRTIGKFVFLDQTRYDIDRQTTILGCTLYTRVSEPHKAMVEARMIEFRETRGWTVEQHNVAHEQDVAWLNQQVENIENTDPERIVIILSHHCPTLDASTMAPHHRGDIMTCAFASDLSGERCWTSPNVRLWAWGHTHWNCDIKLQRACAPPLKCFANQKGYYRAPQETFDAEVAISLPEMGTYHARSIEKQSEKVSDVEKHSEHTPCAHGRRRRWLRAWLSKSAS